MTDEELLDAYKKFSAHARNCNLKKDRAGNQVFLLFSFAEWLQFWIDSGHWHERGCKKGHYVMARHNDLGHYEPGNVSIVLHSSNASEGVSQNWHGRGSH